MFHSRTTATGRWLGLGCAAALTLTAACEDPIDPGLLPQLAVEASASSFADADPNVGTDEVVQVEIRNVGGGQLMVSAISLTGSDAADFSILSGGMPTTLGAGQSAMLDLGFMPMSEGMKSVMVSVESDDGTQDVTITANSTRFQYTQVDRKGIPGLNTVFNHPSGTAGFDKTAYNVAAPSADLATYTAQFETVLGAVGNADPSGTAALLLPDELPVNMGAMTSFATLTGRTLADDAIDVALTVTVGSASLHSDNVDANDRAFQSVFPYVATPNN